MTELTIPLMDYSKSVICDDESFPREIQLLQVLT